MAEDGQKACSGCSGDYENPDLTAPDAGEGDVENSGPEGGDAHEAPSSQMIESEGDIGTKRPRKTLGDAILDRARRRA